MPNHNQSETQTTINSSLECLDVIDIASHQILFGARLDANEREAPEPEEGQLEFEFPAIEISTDQVSSQKSALAKLDQQSMAAIYQRLAELEMFLMFGTVEVVEVPCNRNDS